LGYLQNLVVAAEVSSLVAGIPGAIALAVFSSSIPGSFSVPRSVPATAVLITEPSIVTTSRQSGNSQTSQHHACPRPVINIGQKLKNAQTKVSPLLERFSKIIGAVGSIQSKLSEAKSRLFRKLGLACLFPKLTRPFQPIFTYTRCKLGLNDDGFMETPPCNASACINATIENRLITRDRGLPNPDIMMMGEVSTMDDCFTDMEKVEYGTRIHAKLVDDVDCEDPRYASICQSMMEQNRVLMEDQCQSEG
jgi:hypothetical protein